MKIIPKLIRTLLKKKKLRTLLNLNIQRSYKFSLSFVMAYQHLRLFKAKAILQKGQKCCYLTNTLEDKGSHTFHKCICPKVNLIA